MKNIRKIIHSLLFIWVIALVSILIPLTVLKLSPLPLILAFLPGVFLGILIFEAEYKTFRKMKGAEYVMTQRPRVLFFVFTLFIAVAPDEYKGYAVLSTGFYVATLALILTFLKVTGKWEFRWDNLK